MRRLAGGVAQVGVFLSNLSFPRIAKWIRFGPAGDFCYGPIGFGATDLGQGAPSVYGGPLVTIDTPRLVLKLFS